MLAKAVTFARTCAVPFATTQLRTFAVAADAKTLVMPKLSPKMTTGRVRKWHHGEGELVKAFDVICEISTTELVDDAHRAGKQAANEHIMEIEVKGYMPLTNQQVVQLIMIYMSCRPKKTCI